MTSTRHRRIFESVYPPKHGPDKEPLEYVVALDRSYFGGKKGEVGWKQTVRATSREAAAQTVWSKMEKALLRLIRKSVKKISLYVDDPEMTTRGTLTLLPPITVYNEDIDSESNLEEKKEDATIIDCLFFKIRITKNDFVASQTDAFGGSKSIHPPGYKKKAVVEKFRDFVLKNEKKIHSLTFRQFADSLEANGIRFEVGPRVSIEEESCLRKRGYVVR